MRIHGHLHALIGLALTLIASLSTPTVYSQSQRQGETRTGGSIVPAPRYGSLPLRFEANQGQFDTHALFLLRGPGYKLFLTSNGFVLAPTSGEPIRMTFEGAASSARVIGVDRLPGVSHYLLGSDPARWRTEVPGYGRAVLKGAYPGIEVEYHADKRALEFDLILVPGADVGAIGLRFDDPTRPNARPDVSIDRGDLVIRTSTGVMRQPRPYAYQETAKGRMTVDARYVSHGDARVTLELGAYDRAKPLIIDPVLAYSTFVGGSGNEEGQAIAVDAAGNAYVAGFTSSADFPAIRAAQPMLNGLYDVFVTKLDPTGSSFVFSTFLGGSGWERASGVAIDAAGDISVTGRTDSIDFPTTAGAVDRTCGTDGLCNQDALGPHTDAFVVKLDPTGSRFVYSTYLGGSSYENGNTSDFLARRDGAITVDAAGNAYVTGYTQSPDFPTLRALQPALGGSGTVCGPGVALCPDAFVVKFDPLGALVFSTYLGGTTGDTGVGVALDASNNIYVAGNTSGGYPVTAGAFSMTGSGIFVTKLDPAATRPLYSTLVNKGSVSALAVSASGDGYIAGATADFVFPTTPGAYQPSKAQNFDIVLARLNATGSGLVYGTYLGAWDNEFANGLAIDGAGNAYVAGSTTSPIGYGPHGMTGCDATPNVLVAMLNPSGSAPQFLTCFGGGRADYGTAVAVDAFGNVYVTGTTASAGLYSTGSFPTTPGGLQATFAGGAQDGFVTKLINSPSPFVILSPGAVSFGAQPVGATSAPQTSIVRNTGSAALEIASIEASLDYAQTNTCGVSLAAGSQCEISITFTPSATVTRDGSVTITDNADGSPHRVSLVGWGTGGPAVSLSPTSLDFGSQSVGTTSALQTVTLTNTGNLALTIVGIGTGLNFAQTNTCGSSLAAGTSCRIDVSFAPTVTGALAAMLSISSNAPGSPHFVSLSGTGVSADPTAEPVATLSTTRLNFGWSKVGTTSAPQTVSLTNTGNAPLAIASIVATGDFAQRNTCTAPLAPGGSCAIAVTFTATSSGWRRGELAISDNAAGSPQLVDLRGRGY